MTLRDEHLRHASEPAHLRLSRLAPDPVDEAIVAAGWVNHSGPQPYKHVSAVRTGLKFAWELRDNSVSPHLVVTSGRAWTRAGGRRLVHRAHLAELTERALNRPGARDRRDDGMGCE